jgi:hypothetical protein
LTDWQQAHELRIERALDQLHPDDRQAIFNALPGLNELVHHLGKTG